MYWDSRCLGNRTVYVNETTVEIKRAESVEDSNA